METRPKATKVAVDSETVHNWVQVYRDREPYASLPQVIRDRLQAAALKHHTTGESARSLAKTVAAEFPEHLYATGW